MATSTARVHDICDNIKKDWSCSFEPAEEVERRWGGRAMAKVQWTVKATLKGDSLATRDDPRTTLEVIGKAFSKSEAKEHAAKQLLEHALVVGALERSGVTLDPKHKSVLSEAMQRAQARFHRKRKSSLAAAKGDSTFEPAYVSIDQSETPFESKVTINLPPNLTVTATGAGTSRKGAEQAAAAAVMQDPLMTPYLLDKAWKEAVLKAVMALQVKEEAV